MMAFQQLKGASKKAGEGFSTRACGDKTRGKCFKLKENRLNWILENYSVRVVSNWHAGCPEKL